MSLLEVILRWVAVAALTGFLIWKRRQRELEWSEPEEPGRWPGTTTDLARVRPAIEKLRQHHSGGRPSSLRPVVQRKAVFAGVRQKVRQLGFFRERPVEGRSQDPRHHGMPVLV